MSTYTTMFFGEKMGVSADFSHASDQIAALDSAGNWIPTGKQVADYRHDNVAAMRDQIRDLVRMGGDDPDEEKNADEIEDAIAKMKEEDED